MELNLSEHALELAHDASWVLSCCSTADVSEQYLYDHGIACAYFNYFLDSVPYKDDFGKTHAPDELYRLILAGADPSTSQLSVGDYIEHWKPFLEAGKDVLHVTLSSGISGTYNSALAAKDEAKALYPEREVIVVDSLCASAGFGLLMDKLAELRDAGMSMHEIAEWANAHKLEVQHWFFSSDLTFFVRGGRISKAAGMAGGLLKICPVMKVAADGSLAIAEKIRTKAKAEKRVVALMHELAQDGTNYSSKVFISNSACLDDAKEVAALIEKDFSKMARPVQHFNIGATIGCHTGPGTVATFFWGSPRHD